MGTARIASMLVMMTTGRTSTASVSEAAITLPPLVTGRNQPTKMMRPSTP